MTQGDRDLIERLLMPRPTRGLEQDRILRKEAADRLQALSAEVEMYREALKPFVDGYSHTAVFLSSREKMHSCGRELYAQDVERARQALKGANNG